MTLLRKGGPTSRRGPSYGKSVVIYTKGGQLIAAKWPKGKGGKISQKQREQMEKFRQARWLGKYVPGFMMAELIDLVAGTPLLPADLITQGIYGRLFSFGTADGKVMVPVAFKKDVSQSLDTVGQTEGNILVKTDELWEALAQGVLGQVLMSNGPDQLPEWVNVLDEEQEIMITSSGNTLTKTTSQASYANTYSPAMMSFVSAIWIVLNNNSSSTYKFTVWLLDGDDLSQLLAEIGPVSVTDTGSFAFVFTLPSIVSFIPGSMYAVMITRTDGSGTTSPRIRWGTTELSGFPSVISRGTAVLADNDPQVGDTLTINATGLPNMLHIIYTV